MVIIKGKTYYTKEDYNGFFFIKPTEEERDINLLINFRCILLNIGVFASGIYAIPYSSVLAISLARTSIILNLILVIYLMITSIDDNKYIEYEVISKEEKETWLNVDFVHTEIKTFYPVIIKDINSNYITKFYLTKKEYKKTKIGDIKKYYIKN